METHNLTNHNTNPSRRNYSNWRIQSLCDSTIRRTLSPVDSIRSIHTHPWRHLGHRLECEDLEGGVRGLTTSAAAERRYDYWRRGLMTILGAVSGLVVNGYELKPQETLSFRLFMGYRFIGYLSFAYYLVGACSVGFWLLYLLLCCCLKLCDTFLVEGRTGA